MSDENKGGDATLDDHSDAEGQETHSQSSNAGAEQSVKYETYSRVLGKLKNTEAQFQEMQEKLSRIEQEKLEAEGNKDQLIDSLRKELNERKTREKTIVGSIALSQGKNAVIDAAVKAGCNSPDILTKLLESDLQNLEYDREFKPDIEQVKALVEEARQKNPILFSKAAPKTANHNLNPNVNTQKVSKPIHKMTDEELDNLWKQHS